MDEQAIIEEAKKDVQAFEPLYNKYFDSVFRFVSRKTKDTEEAADLTSRVFWLAMNNIDTYEFRGIPFGAWLYRIALNETNKYFKKRKVQFLTLELDKVDQVMVCGEVHDRDEKLEVVKKLIADLSYTEIRTLELKFFENKRFSEIAFILEESESAVKMRLYRSLDKLKERYMKLTKGTL